MFEPFCFMDMFISIQCKWSNKNHFQLRHIMNQTAFSSSTRWHHLQVMTSVCLTSDVEEQTVNMKEKLWICLSDVKRLVPSGQRPDLIFKRTNASSNIASKISQFKPNTWIPFRFYDTMSWHHHMRTLSDLMWRGEDDYCSRDAENQNLLLKINT